MSFIDYEGRTGDLTDFALNAYGIDQLDMRCIAACLIRTPGKYMKPPWLILETKPSIIWDDLRSCHLCEFVDMRGLQSVRPRYANEIIQPILDNPHIHLLGLEWEKGKRPRQVHERSLYPDLAAWCLRLRPRLPALHLPPRHSGVELNRLLRLVVNEDFRNVMPKPGPLSEPLQSYLKTLMKLNPELYDGNALAVNVSMFLAASAAMEGRQNPAERDHALLYYLLKSSIRTWTKNILDIVYEKEGGIDIDSISLYSGVHRKLVLKECNRLADEDILVWPNDHRGKQGRRRKYIFLNNEWGEQARQFMEGEARWW